MNKQKILFYISTIRGGGAARVMVNLANAFAQANYVVTFVTNFPAEHEYVLSEEIKRISLEQEESRSGTLKKNLQRCRTLRRIIKQENPNVCVSFMRENNFRLLCSSRFLPCRCFVSVRNDPKAEYRSRTSRLIMRLLYPFADGCILQTHDALRGMPKPVQRKGRIIPNMVAERFFNARRSDRPRGIISVGRLVQNKRRELLLKSYAALQETLEDDLYFYGEGNQLTELSELAQQLGISNRVHFEGHAQELVPIYEKAKIFVLTSDYEGLPNALLEALACGVPSISTDCPCGGPGEIIREGMGTLIPVGDQDALTEALRDLLTNPEKQTAYSQTAQREMQAYRSDKVWEQWRDFLFPQKNG